MSKKLSFSVKEEEYFFLESIAKYQDKSVIQVIREFYEIGKKEFDFDQKLKPLFKEIENLKLEMDEMQFKNFEILKTVIRQNVFTNDILNRVLHKNREESEIKKIEDENNKISDALIDNLKRKIFER